jgi:hypothetical protein
VTTPCPSCAALEAIVVQRDPVGRVIWAPDLIAALERQHSVEGRSYKWLGQRFNFNPDSFHVILHHWRNR